MKNYIDHGDFKPMLKNYDSVHIPTTIVDLFKKTNFSNETTLVEVKHNGVTFKPKPVKKGKYTCKVVIKIKTFEDKWKVKFQQEFRRGGKDAHASYNTRSSVWTIETLKDCFVSHCNELHGWLNSSLVHDSPTF